MSGRKKEKVLFLVLTALFAASAASAAYGCVTWAAKENEQEPAKSSGRTAVTMMYPGELTAFEALVEDACPDIDLQVETNAPATINGLGERRLRNGQGDDIILTTMPSDRITQYALDLSAESYVMKYESPIMNSYMVDGKVRFLPLPGQYSGYIYNATLAKQLGIEEIREEQDLLRLLEAASREGVGVGEDGSSFGFFDADRYVMGSYFYGTQIPDFLAMPEGIIWSQKMHDREGSFVGAMDHCTDFAAEMAGKGYLNPAGLVLSRSNATPVQERMLDGTMILSYGSLKLYRLLAEKSSRYEYEMIPLLSSEGNHAWTVCVPDGFLAVNASLGEEKLDACHRVLETLSTPEGQAAFMDDSSEARSYLVEGVSGEAELPQGLRECEEEGYIFNIKVPTNVMLYFGQKMINVLEGDEEMSEALAQIDSYYYNGGEDVDYDVSIIGTVAEDLPYEGYNVRLRETAVGNLIADAVRETTGADMAFVNGGSIRAGFYAGDVYGYDLDEICPYGNLMVVLEADGDTIWKMLENGISKRVNNGEVPGGRFLNVSGLCYSFETDGQNGEARLLSVTLPDGSPVEKDGTYSIVVSDYMAGSSGYLDNNGDGFTMLNLFSDTQPKASGVKLVEETGMTLGDILKSYFRNHADEAVTSQEEGRIVIINE